MPRRFLPILFALWPAAAAALLFGAAGIALDVAWVPRWSGAAVPAVAPPAPAGLPAARRCPQCGRIESKREITPGGADPGLPRIYEYTVRMADGSSSVFEEALPASWRLGERLTLIR